mgnify:FL=1
MDKKNFSKRLLYIPIILLAINFIFRLIDQSKIMWNFPLDLVNDGSSQIAQLFFLDSCGFHKFCPYWYNGFINFQLTPPGWFFFSYPLSLILNDYLKTFFISSLIIFILAFITIYKFGIINNINKTKSILFFFLLFTNAAAIGNYIRLGRIPELFAFFLFVLFAFIILYYKDRKLDWNFIFIIPIYSLLLLSHQTFAVLASLLWVGIFLIKDWKQRKFIFLTVIISLLIDSFWLIPYIVNFFTSAGIILNIGPNLLSLDREYLLENLFSIIIPIVFLFIFFIYIKKNNYNKKEILFYSPVILISFLLLFRVTAFIPILMQIYADVYMGFILFFAFFIFFKNFKINKIFFIGITLLALLSVVINMVHTPLFIKHTQLEKDTLALLKDVKGKFLVTESYSKTSYAKAYYSYAPIYLNLSTPSGWYKIPSAAYFNTLREFQNGVTNKDCNIMKERAQELNNKYVISYNKDCEFLSSCNLEKVNMINNVCLYKFIY